MVSDLLTDLLKVGAAYNTIGSHTVGSEVALGTREGTEAGGVRAKVAANLEGDVLSGGESGEELAGLFEVEAECF